MVCEIGHGLDTQVEVQQLLVGQTGVIAEIQIKAVIVTVPHQLRNAIRFPENGNHDLIDQIFFSSEHAPVKRSAQQFTLYTEDRTQIFLTLIDTLGEDDEVLIIQGIPLGRIVHVPLSQRECEVLGNFSKGVEGFDGGLMRIGEDIFQHGMILLPQIDGFQAEHRFLDFGYWSIVMETQFVGVLTVRPDDGMTIIEGRLRITDGDELFRHALFSLTVDGEKIPQSVGIFGRIENMLLEGHLGNRIVRFKKQHSGVIGLAGV